MVNRPGYVEASTLDKDYDQLPEVGERAVRMLQEYLNGYPSEWAA